jgi:hypothetical protein
LILHEIEKKAKHIFTYFKSGYSSILALVAYIELFIFMLKHKVTNPIGKEHTFMAVCEQLLKILEDESERYESKIDSVNSH